MRFRRPSEPDSMSLLIDPFASNVARVPIAFVNAYLVGAPGGSWTLVDAGLPGVAPILRSAAADRFGPDSRPEAVVLTHGHFDHAGSALALAEAWDVPIYAHRLELPYLTGRSGYAPQDPTMGGAIAQMARVFPSSGYDFGDRVHALPDDGSVPGMPGWRWLHMPGHTNGHVSLWREADRTLLAGDALATVDMDSWTALATMPREISRPAAPFTPDWPAAQASVRHLAALGPDVVAAGHGLPITDGVAERLRRFAAAFPAEVPSHGRYVGRPPVADERGVVEVPPPVPDPYVPRMALAAFGAALAAAVASGRR